MKEKKYRAAAAFLVLSLALGTATTEAAREQDAEKAVGRAVAPTETTKEQVAALAHSEVRVSAVEAAPGSALGTERLLALVPELQKDVVSIAKLTRELSLYNRGGALRIETAFSPDGAGGYRVRISARKAKPDRLGVAVQNSGSRYTGNFRAVLSYANRNLTGHGDTLGLALVGSPNHGDTVKQGAFSYQMILPKAADTVTVTASRSSVELEDLAAGYPFDIASSGKDTRLGLRLQHYFANDWHEQDFLDFGITHHRTHSDATLSLSALRFPIVHYDVSHTDVVADFVQEKQGEGWRARMRAGYQGNFLGRQKDFQAMTYGSARRYHILHGSAGYLRRLTPSGWLFAARAAGQYSRQRLIGCEKFGAGGQGSVRGFDENIRTADSGFSGTLELYTPEILPGLRALAFFDGAALHDKYYADVRLASGGLGLRYDHADAHFALDYAALLGEPASVAADPAGHKRWCFYGGFSF